MTKRWRDNLILRSLTWALILGQVTSSSAFADTNLFSKATLAPQIVSDPTPLTGDDTRATELRIVENLMEIACRVGQGCLVEQQKPEDVVASIRNYAPWAQNVDTTREVALTQEGVLTIPVKGDINEIRVCLTSNAEALKKLKPAHIIGKLAISFEKPSKVADLIEIVATSPILCFDVDDTLNKGRYTKMTEEAAELIYQFVSIGRKIRIVSGRSFDEFKQMDTLEPLLRRLRAKNIKFDIAIYTSDGAEKIIINPDLSLTLDENYNKPFSDWKSNKIMGVIRYLDRRVASEQGLRSKGIASFTEDYKHLKFSWSPYGKLPKDEPEYAFEKKPDGGKDYDPPRKRRDELGAEAIKMLEDIGITDIECIVSGKTTVGFVRKGVSKRKAMLDILKEGSVVYFGDEMVKGNDRIIGEMVKERPDLTVVALDKTPGELPKGVYYVGGVVTGTVYVLGKAYRLCEDRGAINGMKIQDIRELLQNYDIGEIREVNPLRDGMGLHDPFFLIETDKGKFVLRNIRSDFFENPLEAARCEVWTVNTLRKNGVPFAGVIPMSGAGNACAEDNYISRDSEGAYHILYEYAEGKKGSFDNLTDAQANNIIGTMTRAHRVLSENKSPYRRVYKLLPQVIDMCKAVSKIKKLKEIISEKKRHDPKYIYTRGERLILQNADFIVDQLEKVRHSLSPIYGRLPKSLIHGDYSPGNVIFLGDEITGIIDLEHMREEARVYDLVRLMNVDTPSGLFDMDNARRFVTTYNAINPLTHEEAEALPDLYRCKLLERVWGLATPERHYQAKGFNFENVPEEERTVAMLDRDDNLYHRYQNVIKALRNLDGTVTYGIFRSRIQNTLGSSLGSSAEIVARRANDAKIQKSYHDMTILDITSFNLANILNDARLIQDVYRDDRGHWRKDGNFYWNAINEKQAWCRLMIDEKVIFYTDKVVAYKSKNGNIYINIRGDKVESVTSGMDKALIEVVLSEDGRVGAVNMLPIGEMNLSRSAIATQLTDSGIFDKYPDLEKLLKYQLVWQSVDGGLSHRETMDSFEIHLELLDKAIFSPKNITTDEINIIKDYRYFKTKVIRRRALAALQALYDAGRISEQDLSKAASDFIRQDIDEDYRVIERAVKNDGDFVRELFRNLFDMENVSINDIKHIQVVYADQGPSQEIYEVVFLMKKDGSVKKVAMSLVRHDNINDRGLTEEAIVKSAQRWRVISDKVPGGIAKYGSQSWERDYRGKSVIKGGSGTSAITEKFVNNIEVSAREFVIGRNLRDILADPSIPDADKVRYIKLCRDLAERIYRQTGYFIENPHAGQFVLRVDDTGKLTTPVVVDTYRLVDYPSLNDVLAEFDALIKAPEKKDTGLPSDGPLMGHGHAFRDADLEAVPMMSAQGSEAFRNVLDELETVIRQRGPNAMPAALQEKLLASLTAFKNGEAGLNGVRRKIGAVKSHYESTDKYYIGFGTSLSIGLGMEFFDPRNVLYKYRLEAVFHELFHSTRDTSLTGHDRHIDDVIAHYDSIRLAALLFWGLDDNERAAINTLPPKMLELHPKNSLGVAIRHWKDFNARKAEEKNIPRAVASGDWKFIMQQLHNEIENGMVDTLSEFFRACDEAASKRHPVESRWPILDAVSLLPKEEKETLVLLLAGPEYADIRNLPIVDSIIQMLSKEMSPDWMVRQAPTLIDRSTWVVSSEVWNAGGGLGRVEQSHSIGFATLLADQGPRLKTCEPYYAKTINKKTGAEDDTNYAALLGVDVTSIKEIERFEVPVGDKMAVAVCYMAVNKFGIESYLIKGFKQGQSEKEVPYFTERLYHYRNPKEQNLVTLEEYSVFFSKASLELARMVEEKKLTELKERYRPPVMHFNDGQLGFAPLFRKIYYSNDRILGRATVGFTTHTYPNRCTLDRKNGEDVLRWFGIPQEHWIYFYRNYETVVDQTSAGARTADWYSGVSAKHVEDILSFLYDNWKDPHDPRKDWLYLNDTMVSVTNGDVREMTSHLFRETMLKLFPDADVEEPKANEVFDTKREVKHSLGLNPDQMVISFSGRVVREKASRTRAFLLESIEAYVKAGIQVVIGANVPVNPDMVDQIMSLREVQEYIQNKKSLQPDAYKGNFILMENTDIEGQRAILAATDIQVQDSDEKTEAAGYSEADIAVCGGLELAPPWREGILQSQGIPLNFDVLGEGNTLQPKDGRPESYVEIITKVNEELYKAGRISAYQATAVRLSRKLQATLTSAEYFRQWNAAAIKKDAAYGLGVTPSLQHKGSPRACLETIFNSDLKFKNDISIREDLWPKRMKNETDTYSLRMVQEEIRILKALGVIVEGARPNTYRLRSQIRNLSPPELAPILALPELDRYTIPDTETIESLHGRIDEIVSAAYNARPKDVVVAGANEFGKKAAEKVAEEIRKLQKTPGKIITMVFATGNTQVSFLDELSRQTDIDWTRVQAYHLDEYKGLKPNHPASFAYYLNRNLFSKVAIPRDNIHYISEYVERYGEAKGFAEYLKDMSKPDITMTGVGRNAHLAFNEPGSSFNSTLRCVPLDEATVQANKADYPELETDAASRFAYSMGMANIFSSSKIFFLANGEKKAGVVAQAMYGDVTEYVPASMLQMHPNVTWILDKSAAGTSEAQGASIDENMAALDSECRQLLPSVDVGKILYHVIPESLVPEQIRGEMGKIARDTDSRRERIRIVPDKEFVSTLGALSQDKNNVILAAAPDAKVLSSLPKGVKALVFTGEIGGAFGFRQLEGIIAALRALERGDAAALSRIYRILTGSPFKGSQSDIVANIGDPKMLAMYMTFNLKPIVVEDYTELKRLNTRLLEFIRNA